MNSSRIAAAITSAKAYLAASPDEARYRDSLASAVVEDGLRIRVTGADGTLRMTSRPARSA